MGVGQPLDDGALDVDVEAVAWQAREYLDPADLCVVREVRWVVSGKVYDLCDDEDTLGLDIHNMMDKR